MSPNIATWWFTRSLTLNHFEARGLTYLGTHWYPNWDALFNAEGIDWIMEAP